MIRYSFKIISIILALSAGKAYSQTENPTLDPVTISSTISPTLSSRTGRNITIISKEDIQKLPVSSIDELLRYLPGIEVQSKSAMGGSSDIMVRGGTFQQVLVILDGIRINDAITGHFNSYIPISLYEIDRIEILKGSSSAIYGSEAVGGVIHIISKAFAQKVKNNEASIQAAGGDFGLWKINAGGAALIKNHTITGGITSNNANGGRLRGINNYFHNNTASLSYAYNNQKDWVLSLRAAYDKRDFAAQNHYTSFLSDTASEIVTSKLIQAQAAYTRKNVRWNNSIAYRTANDEYYFNPSSIPNNNISKQWQYLSTVDIDMNNAGKLVTGIQTINKGIESNDRGNHNLWQVAAFAVWQKNIGERFNISPALRFDYHERNKWNILPQLNLSYKTAHVQYRASVGKTIRDADFTERFNNYNKAIVTSGRVGNPFLKAETAWNQEIGADIFIKKFLKISVSQFYREFSNMIDYIRTPYADMPRKDNLVPGAFYDLGTNAAKVKNLGFEADIIFKHHFKKNQELTATLGNIWLQSKLPGGKQPGYYLSGHARWITNATLAYSYNRLTGSLSFIYKVRNPQTASAIDAVVTKDYFVANAKVAYNLCNKLQAFVQVDNISNRRYSDLLGAIMPGRWAMAGINVKF